MTPSRTTPSPTLRTGLRATALAAVGSVVVATALAGPAAATSQPTTTDQAAPASTVLTAHLSGAVEVSPTTGALGAGDPDGSGDAAVRLRGDTLDFALSWSKIGAPTRGHVHIGAAGVNGGIEVPFFEKLAPGSTDAYVQQIPGSAAGVTGTVTGLDPAVVAAVAADPAGFYVNVHTAEFPAGAVRGQMSTQVSPTLGAALGGLGALEGLGGLKGVAADPGAVLRAAADDPAALAALGGLPGAVPKGTYLGAVGSGAQEVGPDGSLGAGDADGSLASLSRVHGRSVDYALAWSRIDPPTRAHLHAGAAGANGPVVVPFFELEDVGGLPPAVNGIVGSVRGVDAATITGLRDDTAGYYANVHTAPYPAGAVRGQLVNLNEALRP